VGRGAVSIGKRVKRSTTAGSRHGEDFVEPQVVGGGRLRLLGFVRNDWTIHKYMRAGSAREFTGEAFNRRKDPHRGVPLPRARTAAWRNGPGMSRIGERESNDHAFDELIRLRLGDVNGYQRVRDGAWAW